MKLLNTIFDLKTKHVIKGTLPEIKKKKDKVTCETNPSEKPSINKQTFNQHKRAAIGWNFL